MVEPISLAVKGAATASKFPIATHRNAGTTYEYIKNLCSAESHNCAGRGCHVQHIAIHLHIGSSYQILKKWIDTECYVFVRATIDGCNVFDARVQPSCRSRKSWYNTRRWKVVVDHAYVGRIPSAQSGCPACCDAASCIEFDLYWESSDPFGSARSGNRLIRVCGDGVTDLLEG
jgi:hypothetical protein